MRTQRRRRSRHNADRTTLLPDPQPAQESAPQGQSASAATAQSPCKDSPAHQETLQQPISNAPVLAESPQAFQAAPAINTNAGCITSPAHALHQPAQAKQVKEAAANSVMAASSPDCRTPHHSMLPAPGAYMLRSGSHPYGKENTSSAVPGSLQEDPIVATAWHSKWRSGKVPVKHRKAGSKTWTTLNLQQASLGNQLRQSSTAHPPDVSEAQLAQPPDAIFLLSQQKHNAADDADDIDISPISHSKSRHQYIPSAAVPMDVAAAHAGAAVSKPPVAQQPQRHVLRAHQGQHAKQALAQQALAEERQAPYLAAANGSSPEASETQPELPVYESNFDIPACLRTSKSPASGSEQQAHSTSSLSNQPQQHLSSMPDDVSEQHSQQQADSITSLLHQPQQQISSLPARDKLRASKGSLQEHTSNLLHQSQQTLSSLPVRGELRANRDRLQEHTGTADLGMPANEVRHAAQPGDQHQGWHIHMDRPVQFLMSAGRWVHLGCADPVTGLYMDSMLLLCTAYCAERIIMLLGHPIRAYC